MPSARNSSSTAVARAAESSQLSANGPPLIGTLSVWPSTRIGLAMCVRAISVAISSSRGCAWLLTTAQPLHRRGARLGDRLGDVRDQRAVDDGRLAGLGRLHALDARALALEHRFAA